MENDDLAADKKTQILNAATKLLTSKGLQAFSFEAVANEAGLSRQLIRYYYSDHDVLIADLCDHLANAYQDILVAGIVEVGQVERLGFFLDFFFGVAENYPMPDNLEAYDSLFAYAVGSKLVKKHLRQKYETLSQVIVHELAIAYPQLDNNACKELAFLFVAIMHAHWSFVASLGFSSEHNRISRKAIDRLIQTYINDLHQGSAPDHRK